MEHESEAGDVMRGQIELPAQVCFLLHTLEQNGYQAEAVGGCVRDSLRGKMPHDWDLCTAAPPEAVAACFPDLTVLETGMRHGTVTLLLEGGAYEITTYRREMGYTDHRRPDRVEFVSELNMDLSRRDFTINAMAYHPERGVTDLFGGEADLAAGLIRCVGDSNARFREDALRILRALRFASCFGFSIAPETAQAARANRSLLKEIAAERVSEELCKFLCGGGAGTLLTEFLDIFGMILPGVEFSQPIGAQIDLAPPSLAVRLSILLYDSPDAANGILRRLRLDKDTIRRVQRLLSARDGRLDPEDVQIRRWLNRLGEPLLRELLAVRRARGEVLDTFESGMNALLARGDCYSLHMLTVNGGDLIAMGVPAGRAVGEMLDRLLGWVLDGSAENRRESLLIRLEQEINTKKHEK